ncbi:MAG: Gfo/Idh/MocA family oxidoreductase [Mariniblastus sp.]|nr:Gfo/Idh/MocA family oxidoreductase [Mariniblastus sp.]
MANKTTRRTFVKSTAALGLGCWVAGGVSAKQSRSALEEVRFGCVGVGGKGSSDSADANNQDAHGSKVVAVCDIDDGTLDSVKSKFPGAKQYNDFRKMLDEMGKSIDAVTVSTPDHTHASAAMMAMDMGKHCFCQKPLSHSIYEARMMGNLARDKKLVTQMGNQGTASGNLRLSAALVKNGLIGDVKEVHVWTNRPVWPQSYGLEVKTEPSPGQEAEWNKKKNLVHWDEWIGPADKCAYSPEIHPFKWRGFWDFGTGALGDMACHTLNMSFMALNLRNPTSVLATTDRHDNVTYPKSSKIVFEFPAMDGRPPVKMVWYDGGEKPPRELLKGCPGRGKGEKKRPFNSGALLVGEKGNFYSPGDYGGEVAQTGMVVDGEFTNQRKFAKDVDYPKSPGHFKEFTNAIRGEGTPMSNFPGYAGPLTETILLGNLAVWSGKKVDWDAEKMVAANADESVKNMIRHEYKNGYKLDYSS